MRAGCVLLPTGSEIQREVIAKSQLSHVNARGARAAEVVELFDGVAFVDADAFPGVLFGFGAREEALPVEKRTGGPANVKVRLAAIFGHRKVRSLGKRRK